MQRLRLCCSSASCCGRFIDVCNAIEYAHHRGVLHRDLKPGNIMLGKYGETLVVDWGLAKAKGRDDPHAAGDEETLYPRSGSGSAATQMGSAVGTPAYMSPEQAAGRLDELGPASDVYSLGATLYSILVAQPPFQSGDLVEVLSKIQAGDFPRPRSCDQPFRSRWRPFASKPWPSGPKDRYGSPAALAQTSSDWLADEPVTARRESIPEQARALGARDRALGTIRRWCCVSNSCDCRRCRTAGERRWHTAALAKTQAHQLYLIAQGYLDRWLPGIGDGDAHLRQERVGMRDSLFASAAADFEMLAAYKTADPELEIERGWAWLRLGETRRELGNMTAATEAFETADLHFEQLASLHPVELLWHASKQGRARTVAGLFWQRTTIRRLLTCGVPRSSSWERENSRRQTDLNRFLVLASAHISVAEWLEREGQLPTARRDTDAALSA